MSLWAWGANSHGQLGLNNVSEQVEKPSKVNIDFYNCKVKQIACGGGHTLLLDEEGRLFSCGWNSKLQLATESESHVFERIWSLSGITFINIACGWDFNCAVTDDQYLFVWGSNSHGQLGLPKEYFSECVKPYRLEVKATFISMGLRHTAIINSKAEVWTTGCGKYGQLGLGKDVTSLDRFTQVQNIGKMSHVACGQKHTVAWSTEENALYVWGDNKHGQLVLNTEKYSRLYTPQKIDIDVRQTVKKLLTGWTNVLLWLEDGTLYTWGRNNYGQIGSSNSVGQKTLISLPGGRQVKDVALGSEHTICLATDNTLWAWGWNEHSNTGIQSCQDIFHPTLVPVDTKATITRVYAGSAHNFIVTDNEPIDESNSESQKL